MNRPLKKSFPDHAVHRNRIAKNFLNSVSGVRLGNCNTLVYAQVKDCKSLYKQRNWASAKAVVADRIILNVSGKIFATTRQILGREKCFLLSNIEAKGFMRDSHNRIFIDRNARPFIHILEYLRSGNLNLPKDDFFCKQLRIEAIYYGLPKLLSLIDSSRRCLKVKQIHLQGSHITVTMHFSYHNIFGEIHIRNIFNRVSYITVSGHVTTCIEVFGSYLSLAYDANINKDRYSSRMILKTRNIAQCFNLLREGNFILQTSHEIGDSLIFTGKEKWENIVAYIFVNN